MKPEKIYLSLSLVIILFTLSWISSCTHKADLTGMYQPCLQEAEMIFRSNCVKFVLPDRSVVHCHDVEGQGESGFRLDTIKYVPNGLIIPGEPYSSPVYTAIIAKMGENQMPPSGPISLDNRTIIRLWIEQGANQIPCATVPAR